MSTGNIEVINRSVQPLYANTKDFDLAIYTDTTTQAIHFGCGSNPTMNAPITLSSSNMTINGDLTLGNRLINMSGVRVLKTMPTGTPQNITSIVSSVDGIATRSTNFTFVLSNAQPAYLYLDASNNTMMSLTNSSQLQMNSKDTNLQPAYSWIGDTDTGLFHLSQGKIGVACDGSNVAFFTSDTGGRLGIRTSNPACPLHVADGSNAEVRVERALPDTNNNLPAYLSCYKSRGTNAAPTAVASNDMIGSVPCYAHDGQAYQMLTEIRTHAENSATTNSVGGRVVIGIRDAALNATLQDRVVFRSARTDISNDLVINSISKIIASTGQFQANTSDTASVPSYSWSNDSNTGLYHVGTGQLGITCGGTSMITMDSNRVVIANNKPLSFRNAANAARDMFFVDSSDITWLKSSGGSNMHLNPDSATNLSINYNNSCNVLVYNGTSLVIGTRGTNVGIGTTSPSTTLHVAGDLTVTGNITYNFHGSYELSTATASFSAGSTTVLSWAQQYATGITLNASEFTLSKAGVYVIYAKLNIDSGSGDGWMTIQHYDATLWKNVLNSSQYFTSGAHELSIHGMVKPTYDNAKYRITVFNNTAGVVSVSSSYQWSYAWIYKVG